MNFIFKSLIKRQLKGVPEEQVDMIIAVVEKNPAFFQQIAQEMKAKIDAGMPEQQAAMQVMAAHEKELKEIMAKQ